MLLLSLFTFLQDFCHYLFSTNPVGCPIDAKFPILYKLTFSAAKLYHMECQFMRIEHFILEKSLILAGSITDSTITRHIMTYTVRRNKIVQID